MNMPECGPLVLHYCDRSREGRNLPYLKKCAKKNLHYFRKTLYDVWEGCEITCNPEYTSVLDMGLILNMAGSWIYQGSEYTKVTQASGCAWISLNNSWKCVIISEYPWVCQNIPAYAWIWLNLSVWILSYMPPL